VRRLSLFSLALVLSAATGVALSASDYPFVVAGPWQGKVVFDRQTGAFSGCVAHATVQQDPRQAVLYFSLNRDQNINISLKRPGWDLSIGSQYPVTVSINDVEVAKKNARAPEADLLVIKLAPENVVRSTLERGAVLSINIGTEVLRYPLTDMQPLLTRLDVCVKTRGWAVPPDPLPDDAEVHPPTLEQRCEGASDFVIYHGSWDHEPSAKERVGMREYTQSIAPCVSLWKARCAPVPIFPFGSTNAFCEIQADYALAHLNNRREFEARSETYSRYNSRADEIDRIFKETTDSFFASVQKPIDEDIERQRRAQEAQDRQAAARREEELIGVLRQLGAPRPVTTECVGGNGSVQCITH
jgi:hypothetical protein